ncbi:MAG: 3-deoxy-manno-octulosonate cytidylyltransferase [Acidobacteriota bacterium]
MPPSSHPPRIAAAIPARYASTRLPGKPLLEIAGKTMIEHVYRRAAAVPELSRVVVLTDDERIADKVRSFGGEVEMTPEDCASGSDRIAWAARRWEEDGILNVQGDEPLIDPRAIGRLAHHLQTRPDDPIATLAAPAEAGDLDDPNTVKVVLDRFGYALYFSRSAIPYRRGPNDDDREPITPRKHLGIYGYQREALLELAGLAPSPLERSESLEQLRALENGLRIRVLEVAGAAPGVDTASDLKRIEELLSTTAAGALEDRGRGQ